MPDSVSPYALLRASMPRPADTMVTAYDLYSAAQQAPAAQPSVAPPPTAAQPCAQNLPQTSPPDALPSPARRTHYIADIKTRHSAALRHAALHNQPLS